jgi:hypothetical protein
MFPRDDLWGKIPEADGSVRAAPDPGLRRRRSGVGAGLEPETRCPPCDKPMPSVK